MHILSLILFIFTTLNMPLQSADLFDEEIVPAYFTTDDFCREACCNGPLTEQPIGEELEEDGDEDVDDEEYPFTAASFAHAQTLTGVHEATHTLTTLEGGSSATVAGCVNAISGAYFESQTDLVAPSSMPLLVQRSYL